MAYNKVRVESLDQEGRGIAHADGKVIFIEGALPGELVSYSSYRKKPNFENAQVQEVFEASSTRVTPACPHFGVCGGCSLQHMDAVAQVAAKQRVLEDSLKHIGKVTAETLLPPIYGAAWGYRQRARFSVRYVVKKGGVLVGFHEKRSSYVADMRSCCVVPQAISDLLPPLRALIAGLSIRERVPQIELAIGGQTRALVLRILAPPSAEDEALLRQFADAHGIQWFFQTGGPETAKPYYPRADNAGILRYALPEFDVQMGFTPTDFTQVNHAVNTVLVRRAVALLAPQAGERIADLFCGLGNFSLAIARSGARVLGVEGAKGLVERARKNAAQNGLAANTEFIAANLFEMPEACLPDWGAAWKTFDRMLIDPPRDGAIELVKAIDIDHAPQRIVYVSCNPATLARDAAVLVYTKGYALKAAGIVNMFPHTSHVESIAVFDRESNNNHGSNHGT